jgi:restriction endonuclease S subunit
LVCSKITIKKLFNKISEIDNTYKAKKIGSFIGSFIGYFFTIILIGITFIDKLGDFAVALLSGRSGNFFCPARNDCFFCWMSCNYV